MADVDLRGRSADRLEVRHTATYLTRRCPAGNWLDCACTDTYGLRVFHGQPEMRCPHCASNLTRWLGMDLHGSLTLTVGPRYLYVCSVCHRVLTERLELKEGAVA